MPIKTLTAPERSVSAARVGIAIKGRADLGGRAHGRDDRRLAGRGAGLRRVMEDARQERVEEELPRRQPFDEAHGRPTPRARPRRS
jgi:hypothetical protein